MNPTSSITEKHPILQRAKFAGPTALLYGVSLMIYAASWNLSLTNQIPLWCGVFLNTVATYWFFTVMHDASHSAISTTPWINTLFGYLSVLAFSPFAVYRAFRFIHMQHHRFTNEDRSIDPDHWCGGGRWWTLPMRWATLDLYYYYFYLKNYKTRPSAELREILVSAVAGLSLLILLIQSGFGSELLWLWLLPARIATFFLGLAFDFLPHYPYKATARTNKYQATNNRIGFEWLLTPLLCYQNYHLIHHLYPLVPFYRYLRIWKILRSELLTKEPLLVNVWGHELSTSKN